MAVGQVFCTFTVASVSHSDSSKDLPSQDFPYFLLSRLPSESVFFVVVPGVWSERCDMGGILQSYQFNRAVIWETILFDSLNIKETESLLWSFV